MSEASWLEVVCAPPGLGLEAGQRLPFEGVLGRSRDADVVTQVGTIARRHCRFGVDHGKPWVEDLLSTNGTFVNGIARRGRVELAPGDFIEIPWGLVLRVSPARALTFDPAGELVRLVVDDPHQESSWRVWADHLLEQGDPLGERIARGQGASLADDAKALGPLGRVFLSGGLEVEWRHGFVRRAVIRNQGQWWPPQTWELELGLLLAHPLVYFVEELEIDALSYTRGIDRADRDGVEVRIVSSLEAIAGRPTLPLLHSVRFGPSPRPLWNPRLEGAWRRATEAHPRLRTGPIWVARNAWLQLLATPHGVSVAGLDVGAQRKLTEDDANLIGPIADCAFVVEAPDGSASAAVALAVDRENGLWIARDEAAAMRDRELRLYVNGRPSPYHRIRPGDLIEPAPGLLFRFVME